MRQKRARKQRQTTRSQEAIKNVTTNAIGVAQATNPLITVATYVAVFLTVLPIGLFGFVQVLRAQPGVARTTVLTAEADEAATELTAAERRAQAAREAREAKTETIAAEPEVTVEVVNPGFNGFDMQNADFGTMQTPFAGGFGMMPMPPSAASPASERCQMLMRIPSMVSVQASATSDPKHNRRYGTSPQAGGVPPFLLESCYVFYEFAFSCEA